MTCGDCNHAVPYGDSLEEATCYRFPPDSGQRGPGASKRPRVWLRERECGEFSPRGGPRFAKEEVLEEGES